MLIGALGPILPSSACAAVLYSQTFDYTSASSGSASLFSWNAYAGSSAIDLSTSKTTTTALDVNANATAGFSAKVYNGLGSPHDTQGIFSFDYDSNSTGGLIALDVAAVKTGLSLTGVDSISWASSRCGTYTPVTRLLVQVGGVWYASDTTYTSSSTSVSSPFDSRMATADSFTLTAATATTWRVLTLTAGSSMSLASTTTALDLSTSTVTGVGFYSELPSRYTSVNFDTLVVSSVPEPGSLALAMVGGLGLLLVRLNRRVRAV